MLARLLAIVLVVALRFFAPPPHATVADVPAPVADLADADADAPDPLALVAAPALARPTSRPLAVVPATAAPPVEGAPARLFRPPRARA